MNNINPNTGHPGATLMRLRNEATRKPSADQQAAKDAARTVARSVLAGHASESTASTPSAILRSVAVGLAVTRHLYLATRELSSRELTEALPVITHLSAVAEGLVLLSDDMAVAEMVPPGIEPNTEPAVTGDELPAPSLEQAWGPGGRFREMLATVDDFEGDDTDFPQDRWWD